MLRIAWKFIKFDRSKSIGIVTAIVISVFLIGQQLSLLFFLMKLMGNLVGNAPVSERDVWIIEKQSNNINAVNTMDSRYVTEIASLPFIQHTFPVVIGAAKATFHDGKTAGVTLIGAEAPRFILGPVPQKIDSGAINQLLEPYVVSAEINDAKNWGTDLYLGQPLEINGKSGKINLLTRNAGIFGANLMYTDLKNARYFADLSPTKINLLVAELRKGTDKDQSIKKINAQFPNLRAWDAEVLKKSTISEILKSSNMGMSFGILVVFAMISGFFIIGLTLYSSALDRLKDYGTLKAIGARKSYVNRLIVAQAFIYAVIGYLLAMLLLFSFKLGVAKSGLLIEISIPFSFFLFLVTLTISIGGSLFAVRKVGKLAPASVF